MKSISKLTKNLGKWFSKDSSASESPLLLQSLEDRVLYSAVPLPVDNVDAPVENIDLDDIQFFEIESNTTLPIGEAIAEETSSQFRAQDNFSAQDAATSVVATLEDLEQLVNSIEQNDTASTQDDGPRTAMALAEATPDAAGFYTFDEGQSFTIDYEFLGNPTGNSLFQFGQGFTMIAPPSSGEILVNGEPLEVGTQTVTPQEIIDNLVVFVPDPSFVGDDDFTLEGRLGFIQHTFAILYEGVPDDGVAVFGDTFAPVDGSAPVFEATSPDSETHVESLSNGGYVVASTLGASDGQVMFQIFDNDGVPIGSAVQVANELAVENLEVTAVADGGFLVGYASSYAGGERLNIHRFTETGQELNFSGSSIQLTPAAFPSFDDISIEFLGEDQFVVSFIQSDTKEVQSEIFDFDGTSVKALSGSLIQNSDNISVGTALLSDGRFVRTRVVDNGGSYSIFSSIFDPGGSLEVDVAVASGITGSDVSVVGTTDNGFAVVFENAASSTNGVFVTKLDNSGNIVTSELVAINPNSASPDIVTLDDGSFVVSINSLDSEGTQEVVGQRLNADLTPFGDAFKINSFSVGDQTDSELAVLNDGKLVATFKSDDQATPVKHFHQRLRMSTTGDEDSWISLNSVVGIDPSSSTEVFETLEITGLPIGSKISTGQTDVDGELIFTEVSAANQLLLFNPFDIGPLEFMAPADASGTIAVTATLTTNDGTGDDAFVTEFQVVVNPVDDAPTFSSTVFTTDEDTSLTMTQAEFIGNFIDTEGELPTDLLNSISNVDFVETDFEDRISSSPSPTSGISSSYVFDGTTPLTADLPAIGQAASLELWMRWEDFTGNDRIIAQLGDENQGFSIVQRQDEVVLQFKSDSSEITELSAKGLGGIEGFGSYDQIVVSFGSAAGDPNKLDAAIYLNGVLSESISDVLGAHFADVVQVSNTVNLGSAGGSVGVGASTADNFGGELGLLRFENSMLDADAVQERYNAISNAPRIIGIDGQILESASTINFISNENNIASTFSVLSNGDLQFDPQSDFNQLTHLETETVTTDVVIQRGAQIFDTVTELNVVGVNDLPVQQYSEITIDQNGGTQMVDLNSFVIDPDNFMGSSVNPPADIYLTSPVNGANIIRDGSGFQIELVPYQLLAQPSLVLNIGVVDANNGEVTNHDLTINIVDGNSAPVIPTGQTFDVVEGSTAAGIVAATDPNGDTLTFTLNQSVGDSSLFTISSTGVLTFNSAPDFENPLDADLDNTYEVTVVVDDGNGGSVEETVTVNVTDQNEAPVIAANQTFSVVEGSTSAGNVNATDPNGDTLTFALNESVGDSSLFNISSTGVLTFNSAPDFENPLDADLDNTYEVTVVVNDGNGGSVEELVTVNVTDRNEAPVIIVDAPIFLPEGETEVTTVSAVDPDGDNVTFSLTPTVRDNQFFQIDAQTGELTFRSPPDFEDPQNEAGNNRYAVRLTATSRNHTTHLPIAIFVQNVNDELTLTVPAPLEVEEGELSVGQVSATTDRGSINYTIPTGSGDGDLFQIDANGNIRFRSQPDFETPQDSDGDNIYNFSVTASSALLSRTESVTVEVTNVNENPVINFQPLIFVDEGELFVQTIAVTDPDGDEVTLSIIDTAMDPPRATIDALGNIFLNETPDFEVPPGGLQNNEHRLTIVADDGNGGITTEAIEIHIADLNDAPEITPISDQSILEGETFVATIDATDQDGDSLIYSIKPNTGDGALFNVDANGNIEFIAAPDYDIPNSTNNDNNYTLSVVVDDQNGGEAEQVVNVEVLRLPGGNEAPVFDATAPFSLTEGNVSVGQVSATDPDGDLLVYSIKPNASDGALFNIDANGNIEFKVAPDFDNPNSSTGDNSYTLTVVADDQNGETTEQLVFVEVTEENHLPVIGPTTGFTVVEGETEVDVISTSDADGDTVTLSIASGVGDGDLFHIAPDGTLSFDSPPDFENPMSTNNGNIYTLTVMAEDQNGGSVSRIVNVEVLDANESPIIIADNESFIDEGNDFVQTISATDPDGDSVTFSIFDDGDPPVFTIDASGNLSFINTPDYEVPFDAGGNNIDEVTIVANDGRGGTATQTIRVTLRDVNEAPVFVGDAQQLSLDQEEGSVASFDLLQLFVDPENQNMTLEIAGGADAGLFHIVDNQLTLIDVPELIGPQSPTYEVQIVANDGSNDSEAKTVNLIINNINDEPESSVNAISVSQAELSDASFGLDAQYRSDADGDATSLVIAGDGPDNSLFEIVNDRIQFIDPPTWENGGQNTYVVTTALNDGTVNSEIITFEITVENINDRPEITDFAPVTNSIEDFELSQVRPGIIVADLNQAVTFDKDGDPVNFLLDGTGADNDLFFIDGNNRLRFATTPQLTGVDQRDFEVTVVASDGQLTSAPETIRVSLEDTRGVNVVDDETNSTTNDDPQIQVDDAVETSITPPEVNAPQATDKPDVISTAKPETNPDTIAQPISQRRNDTNGITASSDSKIGDDDVFFELTSDSVSYDYQSAAQGPQLITQEIGDLTESRSTFEDMKLEESMLANYFWQGFEDSEDEFIRRNLQVDNTTIVAASAGLSLGLVSYLRFAAMATTVVTQLPAWKTLDVSPLIKEFDEEEAETIHQIVDE